MKKKYFFLVFLLFTILGGSFVCYRYIPNQEDRAAAARFHDQLAELKDADVSTVTSFLQYLLPLSGLPEKALISEGINMNQHEPTLFANTAQLYFGTDRYGNPLYPRVTYATLRFVIPNINQTQAHEILDLLIQEYGMPQSVRLNNDYTDIEGVAAALEAKYPQESYKLFYDWKDLSIDGDTIDFHINIDYHPRETPQDDYGHIALMYTLPYGCQLEREA